ncbi:MAG: hypothetical protein WBN22_05670 [Verrucomicrobiia bacterium]
MHRAFSDKRGQFRLAEKNRLAAPVKVQAFFGVLANRVAANVNRGFAFGKSAQIKTLRVCVLSRSAFN